MNDLKAAETHFTPSLTHIPISTPSTVSPVIQRDKRFRYILQCSRSACSVYSPISSIPRSHAYKTFIRRKRLAALDLSLTATSMKRFSGYFQKDLTRRDHESLNQRYHLGFVGSLDAEMAHSLTLLSLPTTDLSSRMRRLHFSQPRSSSDSSVRSSRVAISIAHHPHRVQRDKLARQRRLPQADPRRYQTLEHRPQLGYSG